VKRGAAERRERARRYATYVPDLPLASWQKLCWLMNRHDVELLKQAMRFQQIVDILEARDPNDLRRIKRHLLKEQHARDAQAHDLREAGS
jgi:hypothetical protein